MALPAEGISRSDSTGHGPKRVMPPAVARLGAGWFARATRATSIGALLVASFTPKTAWSLDNGLARKPPMGWNSWNATGGNLNAQDAQRIADAIVSTGMKEAGYEFFTIDDCWAENARDGSGNIVPSKALFPNGMKAVADYVHSKGLKFGMYAASTTITCCGRPGSYNHEKQDAQLFASFGADFLKYDWCGVQSGEQGKVATAALEGRYATMRDALAATKRAIVYSMCEKGQETGMNQADTARWSAAAGNMWRNTGDISADWNSILSNFDQQSSALDLQGPGGWNDPDMLEVGNGGLSDAENRSHFALWSVISAPLIAGNDPSKMSATVRGILTNTEVIAIDQDELGKVGHQVAKSGQTEVWSKALADGSRGVVMLNRGSSAAMVNITWQALGIKGPARVRDLWAHADKGTFDSAYGVNVGSHDSSVIRVYPPGSGIVDAGADGGTGLKDASSEFDGSSASDDAGRVDSGLGHVDAGLGAPSSGGVDSSKDAGRSIGGANGATASGDAGPSESSQGGSGCALGAAGGAPSRRAALVGIAAMALALGRRRRR